MSFPTLFPEDQTINDAYVPKIVLHNDQKIPSKICKIEGGSKLGDVFKSGSHI